MITLDYSSNALSLMVMMWIPRVINQSGIVKLAIGKLKCCLLAASIRTLLSLRNALLIVSPAVEMEKVSGVLWRGRGNYLCTITVSNSRHPSSSPPSHSRFRSVALFCSRFPKELQRHSVVLVSLAQTLKCQLKTWAAFQRAPFPLALSPARPVYTCQERIWENLGKEAHGECKQAGELSKQPWRAFNDKLYFRHEVKALTWRGKCSVT